MLSRTSSGVKNIHLFHRNSYLVIVEGSDDGPFWSLFFPSEIDGIKLKLKPVGGKLEVKKYLDELVNHDAKFIVAMDSDYRFFMGLQLQHPRVVETKVHSIENIFLCASNITKLIQNLSRNTDYDKRNVEAWITHFNQKTHSLMIADYIVERDTLGKECMGDKCQRFLKKNTSEFDDNKILQAINCLNLLEKDYAKVKRRLKTHKPVYHARGHFYFSAVHCFISCEVKKLTGRNVSLPTDALYSMALESCHLCESENPNITNLRQKTNMAACDLVKLLKGSPEE